MSEARIGVDRRTRALAAGAVAAIHAAALFALINAFGVDAVVAKVRSIAAFAVPLPPPPPPPEPPAPKPRPKPERAAPAAPRATPKAVIAPKPRVVIPRPAQPAPPVAAAGNANSAGAANSGTGSGAGGNGTGNGGKPAPYVAQGPVKIAGDINNARDYPRDSRDARIGTSVVIALTVATDGRVKACRVVRPSPDPQADAITCRLASERFRFRPARDQNGDPIEASFGWRQSWFLRG